MSKDMEDRLVALESRLAHHERIADDLSDVLAGQARLIERLLERLSWAEERLGALEQGGGVPPNEKPPHY